MAFFHYRQNNSGGYFTGPAINVIVEANSAVEADARAQTIGLYFGGAGDCPCCGDRWSSQWGDEGDAEPSVYGKPVAEHVGPAADRLFTWESDEAPEALVLFADGRQETHRIAKAEGSL